MHILLPRQALSVSEIANLVTADEAASLKQRAYPHEVDVLLPKYQLSTHIGAKDALSAMGVRAALDNQSADFDRMIHKKYEAFRVYISQIYHDAWIDVHEEGTEAAAATTSVGYSFGCSAQVPPRQVDFHGDHPFLLLIVHNQSRSILFAGWLSDPTNVGS
jgi:serpin B